MTPEQTQLVEAFRDLEAAFRQGRVVHQSEMVDGAVELVAAGITVAGVIAVAGDDRVETIEICRDLDRASVELERTPMTDREVVIRAQRWIARALLEGTISVDRAAEAAWDSEVVTLAPDFISEFAVLSLDYPEWTTEAMLRETASNLLEKPLPEEFRTTR